MKSLIDPRDEALDAAKRSVDEALDLWEAPGVSPDFDRRLYRRIEQDVPWWSFLVRPQRLVPAGAAAALLIAAGLWIGRPGMTPAPRSAAIEALPPDQAEDALHEMQMFEEFNRLVRATCSPTERCDDAFLAAFAGLLAASRVWPLLSDAARPVLPRKGLLKGGIPRAPQMGPPLSNPGSQVARLYRATPEERERALEKLPARVQEQFRQQLARFDAMPKPQQEVLIRRAERYAALRRRRRRRSSSTWLRWETARRAPARGRSGDPPPVGARTRSDRRSRATPSSRGSRRKSRRSSSGWRR
jgi:hypothetical protein